MRYIETIDQARKGIMDIISNPQLTHEQTIFNLAKFAENMLEYPKGTSQEFLQMKDDGIFCDLGEGHAPYCARYILPDYSKFMKQGSKHFDLAPPTTLQQAVTALVILYRGVPSVTHFPVYMGEIDTLLEPFITDVDKDKEIIKNFLIICDRTFTSSFCHMNLSGKETKSGHIFLELLEELKNAIPNFTVLYDPETTPDSYATKAIKSALESANPAFAHKAKYTADFGGKEFGIVSCYNGLPVGGGAHTLSRVRLNKVAQMADSKADFMDNVLPEVVKTFCEFLEAKTKFLVEETPFYKSHFLVREGLIDPDNFIGLFGIVGLGECSNILLEYEGESGKFGECQKANDMGVEILERLQELVSNFETKYSPKWGNKFMLHAQVGAENDVNTSPGVRIPVGDEIEMYEHLKQAGMFHKYFPTGVGDIFPFDSTGLKNPEAILDIFKGAFNVGMRYISTYKSDGDLVRVTGYLVKKVDIEKFKNGEQVLNDTHAIAQNSGGFDYNTQRKVREV